MNVKIMAALAKETQKGRHRLGDARQMEQADHRVHLTFIVYALSATSRRACLARIFVSSAPNNTI